MRGYIRVGDLLLAGDGFCLESLLQPLVFVPETRRLDRLLRDFLTHNWVVVAVVDEYGGLAGTITLEELFAEVVGEFEMEGDEEVVRLDPDSYRLSGQLSVRAWRDLFVGVLPEQEVASLAFDTLGGFVISRLGRMPGEGDAVTIRNLCLTVESIRNGRITSVLLRRDPSGESA